MREIVNDLELSREDYLKALIDSRDNKINNLTEELCKLSFQNEELKKLISSNYKVVTSRNECDYRKLEKENMTLKCKVDALRSALRLQESEDDIGFIHEYLKVKSSNGRLSSVILETLGIPNSHKNRSNIDRILSSLDNNISEINMKVLGAVSQLYQELGIEDTVTNRLNLVNNINDIMSDSPKTVNLRKVL